MSQNISELGDRIDKASNVIKMAQVYIAAMTHDNEERKLPHTSIIEKQRSKILSSLLCDVGKLDELRNNTSESLKSNLRRRQRHHDKISRRTVVPTSKLQQVLHKMNSAKLDLGFSLLERLIRKILLKRKFRTWISARHYSMANEAIDVIKSQYIALSIDLRLSSLLSSLSHATKRMQHRKKLRAMRIWANKCVSRPSSVRYFIKRLYYNLSRYQSRRMVQCWDKWKVEVSQQRFDTARKIRSIEYKKIQYMTILAWRSIAKQEATKRKQDLSRPPLRSVSVLDEKGTLLSSLRREKSSILLLLVIKSWQRHTRQVQHTLYTVNRKSQRRFEYLKRHAFSLWNRWVSRRRKSCRKLYNICNRRMLDSVERRMSHWKIVSMVERHRVAVSDLKRDAIVSLSLHQQKVSSISDQVQKSQNDSVKSKVLQQWRHLTRLERLGITKDNLLLSQQQAFQLRLLLWEWRVIVKEKSRIYNILRRWVENQRRCVVRIGFGKWKQYLHQVQFYDYGVAMKKSQSIIVNKMQRKLFQNHKHLSSIKSNVSMSKCFLSWKILSNENKEHMAILSFRDNSKLRIAQRLLQTRVFTSWKHLTIQISIQKRLLIRLFQIAHLQTLRSCVNSWKTFAYWAYVGQMKDSKQVVAKLLAARSKLLELRLKKHDEVSRTLLFTIFHQWRRYYVSRARAAYASALLQQQIKRRVEFQMWNEWKSRSYNRIKLVKVVKSILSRLIYRQVSISFHHWKYCSKVTHILERSCKQTSNVQKQSLVFARSFGQKLVTAGPFHRWQVWSKQSRLERARMLVLWYQQSSLKVTKRIFSRWKKRHAVRRFLKLGSIKRFFGRWKLWRAQYLCKVKTFSKVIMRTRIKFLKYYLNHLKKQVLMCNHGFHIQLIRSNHQDRVHQHQQLIISSFCKSDRLLLKHFMLLWKVMLDGKKLQRKEICSLTRKIKLRRSKTTFCIWKRVGKSASRKCRVLKTLWGRYHLMLLNCGFRKWMRHCDAVRSSANAAENLKKTRKLITIQYEANSKSRVHRVFTTWSCYTHLKVKSRLQQRNFFSDKSNAISKRRLFFHWKHSISLARIKLTLLRRLLCVFNHYWVRRGFKAFQRSVLTSRSISIRLNRKEFALKQLKLRGEIEVQHILFKCFALWRHLFSDGKRLLAMAESYNSRISLRKRFHCWTYIYRAQKVFRKSLLKLISRHRDQSLATAVRRWKDSVMSQRTLAALNRYQLSLLNSKVSAALHRGIKRYFSLWKSHYKSRQRCIIKVIRAIEAHRVFSAFRKWKSSESLRSMRITFQKFLNIMRRKNVLRAYRKWVQYIAKQSFTALELKHALAMHEQKNQALTALRYFYSWKEFILNRKIATRSIAKRFAKLKIRHHFIIWTKHGKAGKILKHWQRRHYERTLGSAFVRWRCNGVKAFLYKTTHSQQRSFYVHLLQVNTRYAVSRAFVAWKGMAQHEISRKEGIRRWHCRLLLRKTFNKLFQHSVTKKQERKILCIDLLDSKNGYFLRWVVFTNQQVQIKKQIHSLILRMIHRGQRAALNTWIKHNIMKGFVLKRQQRVLKSIELTLNSTLKHALLQWKSSLEQGKARRNLVLDRVKVRVIRGSVMRALGAWKDYCSCRDRARCIMRTVVRHLVLKKLSNALQSWKLHGVLPAVQENGMKWKKWHDNQILKVVQRMKHKNLLGIFLEWKRKVALKIKIGSIIHTSHHVRKRQVTAKWKAFVYHRIRKRTYVGRCIARRNTRQLQQGLQLWKVKQAIILKQSALINSIVRRLAYRKISTALWTWKEHKAKAIAHALHTEKVCLLLKGKYLQKQNLHYYKRWVSLVLTMKAKKEIVIKIIKSLHHRVLSKGIRKWKEAGDSLTIQKQFKALEDEIFKLKERNVENSQSEKQHRALSKKFRDWSRVVLQARFKKEEVRHRLCVILGETSRKYYSIWKEKVVQRHLAKRILTKVVCRKNSRSIRVCWRVWSSYSNVSSILSSFSGKSSLKQTLSRFFGQWKNSIECIQAGKAKAKLAILSMRSHRQVIVFTKWKQYLSLKKEARAQILLICKRILNKRLTASLRKWNSFVISSKFAEIQMKERHSMQANLVMKRLVSNTVFRCFSAWSSHVKRRNEVLGSIGIIIGKRNPLKLYMKKWRLYHNSTVMRKAKLTTILRRMQTAVLSSKLRKWSRFTLASMIKEEEELKYKSMLKQRILKRMSESACHRNLCASFHIWSTNVSNSKNYEIKQGELLKSFMLRWKNIQLSKVFQVWVLHRAKLMEERRIITIALQRMQNRILFSALTIWTVQSSRERVIESFVRIRNQRAIHRSFTNWLFIHKHKEWQRKQVLTSWSKRLETTTFRSWRRGVALQIESRALLAKVLSRATNVLLHSGFASWYKVFCCMKEADRENIKVLRFVSRWNNLKERNVLTLSFRRWNLEALRNKQHQKLLQKVLKDWVLRKCRSSFHTWAESNYKLREAENTKAKEKIVLSRASVFLDGKNKNMERLCFSMLKTHAAYCMKKKKVLQKVGHFKKNSYLSHFVSRWKIHVLLKGRITKMLIIQRKKAIEARFMHWRFTSASIRQEELRQLRRLVGIARTIAVRQAKRQLSRSQEQIMSSVFSCWYAVISKKKRQCRIILLMSDKKTKSQLKMIFSAWKRTTRKNNRLRILLKRSVAPIVYAFSKKGFNTWRHRISRMVEAEKAHKEKIRAAITAWQSRIFVKTFRMWKLYTTTEIASRRKAQRAAIIWGHQLLYSSFYSWSSNVAHRIEVRKKMLKVAKNLQNRTCRVAISQWRLFVVHSLVFEKSMRSQSTIKGKHMRINSLKQIFHKWTVYYYQHKTFSIVAIHMSEKKAYQNRIKLGWKLWYKMWTECKRRKSLISTIIRRLLWRTHLRVFNRLKCYKLQRLKESVVQRIPIQILALRIFMGWKQQAQRMQRAMKISVYLSSSISSKYLRKILSGWRAETTICAAKRTKLYHTMCRMVKRRILGGFRAWYSNSRILAPEVEGKVVSALLQYSTSRQVIQSWKKYTLQRRSLRRFVHNWNMRTESKCIKEWKSFLQKRRSMKKKMKYCSVIWIKIQLSSGFSSWKRVISRAKAKEAKLRGVIETTLLMDMNFKRLVFMKWVHAIQISRQKTFYFNKLVKKAQQMNMRHWLLTWKNQVQDSKAKARCVGRVISRMRKGQLHVAFNLLKNDMMTSGVAAKLASAEAQFTTASRHELAELRLQHKNALKLQTVSLISNRSQNYKHDVLQKWKMYCILSKRANSVLRSLFKKWERSHLSQAWYTWTTSNSNANIAILQQISYHSASLKHLREHVFHIWRLSSNARSINRSRCLQIYIKNQQKTLMSRILAAWKRSILTKKRVLKSLVIRMCNKNVYRGFQEWKLSVQRHKLSKLQEDFDSKRMLEKAKYLSYFLQKTSEKCIRSFFFKWRNKATAKSKLNSVLNGILKHWIVGTKRISFCHWKKKLQYCQQDADKQRLFGHIICMIRSKNKVSLLRRVLNSWYMVVTSERTKLLLIFRKLSTRRADLCRQALGKWLKVVEEGKEKDKTLLRIVTRHAVHLPKMRAWKQWSTKIEAFRIEHLKAELELANTDKQKRVLRFIVAQNQAGLKEVFLGWKNYKTNVLQKLSIFNSEFQHRILQSTFNRFVAFTATSKNERRKILKMIVIMNRPCKRKAFRSWNSFTQGVKQHLHEAKLLLKWQRMSKTEQLLRRLRHQKVHLSFTKWMDECQAAKLKLNLMTGLIVRIKKAQQYRSFDKWRQEYLYEVRQAVEYSKKLLVVGRIATGLRTRYLIISLARWMTFNEQQKDKIIKLQHLLRTAQNYQTGVGFRCWVSFTETQQLIEKKKKEVLGYLLRKAERDLRDSLSVWRSFSSDEAARKSTLMQAQSLIRSILMRMKKRKVNSAFSTWKWSCKEKIQLYNQQVHRNKLVSMRIAKVLLKCSASIFFPWKDFTMKRKRQRLTIELLFRRKHAALQKLGLNSWKEFSQLKERGQKLMKSIMNKILYRGKSIAFRRWLCNYQMYPLGCLVALLESKLQVLESEKVELKLHHATMYLRRRDIKTLYQTFSGWKKLYNAALKAKKQVERVLRKLLLKSLSTGFSQWNFFVLRHRANEDLGSSAQRQRDIQARHLRMILNQAHRSQEGRQHVMLQHVFDSWSFLAQSLMKRKALCRKILHRYFAYLPVQRLWRTWKQAHSLYLQQKKVLIALVASRLTSSMRKGLRQWQRSAKEVSFTLIQHNQRNIRIQKWVALHRRMELHQLFSKWNTFVDDRVRCRSFCLRLVTSTRKKLLRFSFAHFKTNAVRQNSRIKQVQRLLNIMLRRSLHAGFSTWKDHVLSLKVIESKDCNKRLLMKQLELFKKREDLSILEQMMARWKHRRESRRLGLLLILKVAQHFVSSKLRASFQRLCISVKSMLYRDDILYKRIDTLWRKSISMAFLKWTRYNALDRIEMHHRKHLSFFLGPRNNKSIQQKAFSAWKSEYKQTLHFVTTVFRSLSRSIRNKQLQSFIQWKVAIQDHREKTYYAKRIVTLRYLQTARIGFSNWHRWSRTKAIFAATSLLLPVQRQKLQLQKQCAQTLSSRRFRLYIAQVFQCWKEACYTLTERRKRLCKILVHSVTTMGARTTASALRRWKAATVQEAELRRVFRSALVKSRNRRMRQAFVLWSQDGERTAWNLKSAARIREVEHQYSQRLASFHIKSVMMLLFTDWSRITKQASQRRKFATRRLRYVRKLRLKSDAMNLWKQKRKRSHRFVLLLEMRRLKTIRSFLGAWKHYQALQKSNSFWQQQHVKHQQSCAATILQSKVLLRWSSFSRNEKQLRRRVDLFHTQQQSKKISKCLSLWRRRVLQSLTRRARLVMLCKRLSLSAAFSKLKCAAP